VLESKGLPVLTRIKEVKFKNMVRPDDLLQIEVELVEEIGGAYFMKGMAKVAGKVVLRTEFAAIISTR
jgi:3-hydroxyacyl-[acyl-carrier-protein] dehydratase